MKRSLSVYKIRTFHTCPQLFKLRCVDGYEPIRKSEALSFGNLFHAGLNAWHSPDTPRELRLDYALAALRSHWEKHFRELDAYAGVTAEELMKAYHAQWHDDRVSPIGVEVPYDVPLVNPISGKEHAWRRGGRMDLVLNVPMDRFQEERRVVIGEHKTTAEDISHGSAYWTKLRIDTQVSEYMRAAEAHYGQRVDYVLYDVVLKPDITPQRATPPDKRKMTKGKPCKKHATEVKCANCDGSGWIEQPRLHANMRDRDEHPEEWRERLKTWLSEVSAFARQMVHRLEDELLGADLDTWQTANMIDSCAAANVWPKNDGSCKVNGRNCDFRDVCLGVASITDPTRFKLRTYDDMKEDRREQQPAVRDPDQYDGGAAVSDPEDSSAELVDDPGE